MVKSRRRKSSLRLAVKVTSFGWRLSSYFPDARERFTEDALRMMRAVRFSAQLGYTIEENTKAAIKIMYVKYAPRRCNNDADCSAQSACKYQIPEISVR